MRKLHILLTAGGLALAGVACDETGEGRTAVMAAAADAEQPGADRSAVPAEREPADEAEAAPERAGDAAAGHAAAGDAPAEGASAAGASAAGQPESAKRAEAGAGQGERGAGAAASAEPGAERAGGQSEGRLPELKAAREGEGELVGGEIEDSDFAYVGRTEGASFGFVAGVPEAGDTGADIEARPAPGLTRQQAGLPPTPEEGVGGPIERVEPQIGRRPGASWGYVEGAGTGQAGELAAAEEAGAAGAGSGEPAALGTEARSLVNAAEARVGELDARMGRLDAPDRDTARLRRLRGRALERLNAVRTSVDELQASLEALETDLEAVEEARPAASPGS